MKITFVYKGRYQVRDAKILEYCSAIARADQHLTKLVWDQDIFGISDNVFYLPFLNKLFSQKKKLIADVLGNKPDMAVFFDGLTRQKWNAQTCRRLKKKDKNINTVLLCYWMPPEEDLGYFDKILIGDPETTFRKFIEKEQYSAGKKVFQSEKAEKLDLLPLPDTDLFGPKVNFKDSYLIYTSKGCPYNCSYCEESVYAETFGREYFRQMSQERILKELKAVKDRYSPREIIFKDSVFAGNREWVLEFLEKYRKTIDIPFKCFAKAGPFDEQIAKALVESKCYCVEFGVQTFNQKIKEEVLQRPETNEAILNCFAVCDKLGLSYDADHLFGIPGETADDHIQAAKHYLKLKKLNRIKCHNLVYYKQAKIYDLAPGFIRQEQGYEADFFSVTAGSPEMKKINRIFEKYFKILPLLPEKQNLYLLAENRWKIIRFVPDLLILMMMLVLAFKNRDKRFWVYFKYYPIKIVKAISGN